MGKMNLILRREGFLFQMFLSNNRLNVSGQLWHICCRSADRGLYCFEKAKSVLFFFFLFKQFAGMDKNRNRSKFINPQYSKFSILRLVHFRISSKLSQQATLVQQTLKETAMRERWGYCSAVKDTAFLRKLGTNLTPKKHPLFLTQSF